MTPIHIKGKDPREFMNYHGKTYINGTTITVKDEYIATHTRYGKQIWKYAKFAGTVYGNDGVHYYFYRDRYSYGQLLEHERQTGESVAYSRNNYAPNFSVRPWELDDVIEQIIHPITVSQQEQEIINKAYEDMVFNPKTDLDYPEMAIAWVIYIVAMLGSLIFTQFYLLWPIITLVFLKYRKGVME